MRFSSSYFTPQSEQMLSIRPTLNGHMQEGTGLSTAETMVNFDGDQTGYDVRPSRISNLSHITTTTLQQDDPGEGELASPEPESCIKPISYRRTVPPVIPEKHTFRTLVLCFDGTGDQFDIDNSNVVEFFSMLKKDDKTKQMVYYQAGIGTYTQPQIITPALAAASKLVDEMVAWNLDAHVMDGYTFLMENYIAGDRINILGFSRGAYTARALAGMLHKVGLLPASNHQQVPFAYKMYARDDDIGWKQSDAFKKAFCNDVEIEFIGVWDTVASVGLISRRLPFTADNTVVKTFRHALALDEHRAKFKANLWNRHKTERCSPVASTKTTMDDTKKQTEQKKKSGGSLSAFEDLYETHRGKPPDVREVWFSGCHSDVGGGSVPNETPHSLARISLRWMVKECFRTRTGIMFNSDSLYHIGLDPLTLLDQPCITMEKPPMQIPDGVRIQRVPKTSSLKAKIASIFRRRNDDHASVQIVEPLKDNDQTPEISEEAQDMLDITSPSYDQLKLKWYWWILEVLPMEFRYQKNDDSWGKYSGCNLGRSRVIPHQRSRQFYVHRSVRARMGMLYEGERENGGKRYVPRAKINVDRATWVD